MVYACPLLLLLPLHSAHVVNAWTTASTRLNQQRSRPSTLQVITEPDRSAELGETPDYFLQTEDFAGDSHPPEKTDETKERTTSIKVKRRAQLNLPPRLSPNVGWEHHHHATVNFVHGMRQTRLADDQLRTPQSAASQDDESDAASAEIAQPMTYQDDTPLVPPALEDDTTRIDDDTEEGSEDEIEGERRPNPVFAFWERMRNRPKLVSESSQWKRLQKHAEYMKTMHLREMLQDKDRCDSMYATVDGLYLDYSRQFVTVDTMKFLYELAEKQNLSGQIKAMMQGEKINFTEKRAVLHTALRAGREEIGTIFVDDVDVVQEVHDVLDQIKEFTEGVRSGKLLGYTGKRLRNIVSVGIGGSYLGPEFLHECLKTEPEGVNSALGYR